jgi:protein gp37
MSDFFHPGADAWRKDAWEVMHECDKLDWLVLTKRLELIVDRLPSDWSNGYSNVWLGVTVESQKQVERLDGQSRSPEACGTQRHVPELWNIQEH